MKLYSALFIILFTAASVFCSAVDDNQNGVDAMAAGRFDNAVQSFSLAHAEDPDNTAVKHNLVTACNNAAMDSQKNGNFDKAYAYMKQAYALEPGSLQLKKNFAYLLINESQRRSQQNTGQDVTPLLKESLQYDDSVSDAHYLLGQVYYDNDNYPDAREQWDKALALDPKNAALKQKLDKLNVEMATDDKLRDAGRFHFKVRYEGTDLWVASQEVLDMLEDAWNNAGWKLGTFPQEPITVIINSKEEFQAMSGRPDWYAGVYDGKIRILTSDLNGDQKRLRQIIYHEYMHAYIRYTAGNNVPTWLNEGLAQCYENMPDKPAITYWEKKTMKDRLTSGNMPNLEQVDMMFRSTTSQADVNFAYAYSKLFTAYLIDKGWDINIKNILEELRKGTALNDAFEAVFCRSIDQMSSDWLDDLKFSNQ